VANDQQQQGQGDSTTKHRQSASSILSRISNFSFSLFRSNKSQNNNNMKAVQESCHRTQLSKGDEIDQHLGSEKNEKFVEETAELMKESGIGGEESFPSGDETSNDSEVKCKLSKWWSEKVENTAEKSSFTAERESQEVYVNKNALKMEFINDVDGLFKGTGEDSKYHQLKTQQNYSLKKSISQRLKNKLKGSKTNNDVSDDSCSSGTALATGGNFSSPQISCPELNYHKENKNAESTKKSKKEEQKYEYEETSSTELNTTEKPVVDIKATNSNKSCVSKISPEKEPQKCVEKNRPPGNNSTDITKVNELLKRQEMKNLRSLQKEQKATRLLASILAAFILLWLPYNVFVIINAFNANFISSDAWNVGYWLCYLNSTLNPVLYALCNKDFKLTFKYVLQCKWMRSDRRRYLQQMR